MKISEWLSMLCFVARERKKKKGYAKAYKLDPTNKIAKTNKPRSEPGNAIRKAAGKTPCGFSYGARFMFSCFFPRLQYIIYAKTERRCLL